MKEFIKLPPKKDRHVLFGSVQPGEKTKPTEKEQMADLQNTKKNFLFTIQTVGISEVKHPIKVKSTMEPKEQTTIGTFLFSSKIPYDTKGTNMSRFTEQLEEYRAKGMTLTFQELRTFAVELAERLKTKDATIEVTFPWFYERKGPMSGSGGLNHAEAFMKVTYEKNIGFTEKVGLKCAITTLCPCSKEISEYSAHNQRGFVTMNVTLDANISDEIDWKKELLEAAESNASARIHPVLKRTDEKAVTELAYENPRFVEDMVRLVAADLYEMDFVKAFDVECRNEESIHLHDAIAKITFEK